MSISFLQAVLASTIGVGLYFLITEIYYEVRARIRGKQYQNFFEDWEEEHVDF